MLSGISTVGVLEQLAVLKQLDIQELGGTVEQAQLFLILSHLF
jgi:hypothetical protein